MMLTHFAVTATFMLSTLGLAFHRKHLVSALLCIEGMMLALFLALTVNSQTLSLTTMSLHPITLLTLAACEAGSGLALLVASSRTHASDNLKALNLLKC
uniref:NADH-ubiquinone oxidoreductase chain 4L n=1 Tax=Gekko vittatus TaxID=278186 RepID=A1IGQ7_9SAUR|nr:NADH dehydrogenase subunit 4L [Gekko vittatus]BAF44026.1 NADH dehydrogenase subunit 4L [Gekko vittatus]